MFAKKYNDPRCGYYDFIHDFFSHNKSICNLDYKWLPAYIETLNYFSFNKEESNLIVNAPPGAGKSQFGTRIFSVFYALLTGKVIIVTQSIRTAKSIRQEISNILESKFIRETFGITKSSFVTNNVEGISLNVYDFEIIIMTTGSNITGLRGYLIIFDDAVNPTTFCSSIAEQNSTKAQIRQIFTRSFPDTKYLLIESRSSQKDLTSIFTKYWKEEGIKFIHFIIFYLPWYDESYENEIEPRFKHQSF